MNRELIHPDPPADTVHTLGATTAGPHVRTDRRYPNAPGTGSAHVLLAPVTITPTKPLTPSHVKFLLWMDVLHRATALVHEVSLLYRHRTFAVTYQVTQFWEFLDRCHPGLRVEELTDEQIGALYVDSHRGGRPMAPAGTLGDYIRRVDEEGWLHPVTERILDIWDQQLRTAGVAAPGLGRDGGPGTMHAGLILDVEQTLDLLREKGLCLDPRGWSNGPVYLDASAHGLPLRQLVDASGRPNYLLCALRELLPLAARHDRIVLACDAELAADYRLLARILEEFGASTVQVEVTRVPLAGTRRSTRHGGWEGVTLGRLCEEFVPEHGVAPFRLGLRLYLIAGLGKGDRQSFDLSHLRRQIQRAAHLLQRHGVDPADVDLDPRSGLRTDVTDPLALRRTVRALAGDDAVVDPYRLTSGLLGRHAPVRQPGLLRAVFL